MTETIAESESEQSGKFIDDNFTRVEDGGIITQISEVKQVNSLSKKVKMYIEQPDAAGPWTYDYEEVVNWDEDTCWLVELAKERGVGLENLDELEGEEVYIYRKEDESGWYMSSEHPSDLFDDEEIGVDAVPDQNSETLETVTQEDENQDIEKECLEYQKIGDYFRCEVIEINEITIDGRCNHIELVVDTPYDDGRWEFKKPYGWNEENPLVQMAEERSYGEGNFTKIVGEDVLVKREDDEWELSVEDPDDTNLNPSSDDEESISRIKVAILSVLTVIVSVLTYVFLTFFVGI